MTGIERVLSAFQDLVCRVNKKAIVREPISHELDRGSGKE